MTRTARATDAVLPASEWRALLAHASGWSPVQVLTRSIDELEAGARARFEQLVDARRRGEPIAYLTGVREFHSRPFVVDRRVLIPRHETEHLVEIAIAAVRARGTTPTPVLDLGTGSGILAITLALECPNARVVATDRSADALAVARANADRLGAAVDWREGSWYRALADGERFDVIVSNPPYIAHDDPHLDDGDLRFEPRVALTDGDDGLGALAAIVGEASAHLRPGGLLAVEHGFDQGGATRRLFEVAGFHAITGHRDLAGLDRVTEGTWPAPDSNTAADL